jgi:muramoyltetrapeptide carboxypeptidase
MIQPAFLTQGNTVCILAPGRKLDSRSIEASVAIIQSWGLNVTLSHNLLSEKHSYLSGTDAERLHDFQKALDDSSIKAIICARGGYGATRILDQLDFSTFLKSPKWICGFSDITALHLKLQSLNTQSIHSTMPVQLTKTEFADSAESLRKLLFGTTALLTAKPSTNNRMGIALGKVVGGNLSLLTDSLGTSTEIQTDNKILVIEEIGEYTYRLDRMLVQLKRAGKLKNLAGLVVGHMTDIKESELPFGESVEQIILNHTREFGYPIGFNFPTGHEQPNLPWIEGSTGKLDVTTEKSSLSF